MQSVVENIAQAALGFGGLVKGAKYLKAYANGKESSISALGYHLMRKLLSGDSHKAMVVKAQFLHLLVKWLRSKFTFHIVISRNNRSFLEALGCSINHA